MLQNVVDCKSCFIWGRDSTKVQRMIEDLRAKESVQAWGLEIAKMVDRALCEDKK